MGGQVKTVQQREEDGTKVRSTGVLILLVDVPPSPDHFDEDGKKLWEETAKHMIDMRTLMASSLVGLEQFVMLHLMARKVYGNKKARLSQVLSVMREARLAAEDLGLTPSAHARVKRPEGAVLNDDREKLAAELIDA